jgi:peptide/nickel transport system permease protein
MTENESGMAQSKASEIPEAHVTKKISYWQVVWGQFRKNKVALAGLWCIFFLLLISVYSPLISMNVPFYVKGPQGVSYPFFKELFNRNCFENGVDIFFNLILILSPLYLMLYLVLTGVVRSLGRFKVIAGIAILHFLIFLFVEIFPHTTPMMDYKGKIAEQQAAGIEIKYTLPPIPYSYREIEMGDNPQPPSRKHLLGTDTEGRDVFSRMLYGTRISMTIGVVAVSIYLVIGIILGALAGYFGGKVDLWISRLIEVVICFPTFFLILTLAAFIEKRTIFHVMLIIGLVQWTGVARLVRGEFLRLRELDYVQAAIALGMSKARIIFGHILPNAMAPVLVSATFGVAAAILIESSLAFLGLGDPTAPSWGGILSVGRTQYKLWLILSPGLAIFFVVSVFNLVGEILRDAMDPKLRQ